MGPRPLTEILSSAIVPVTLVTGVAFITSIMTPRFGRCIDRIRNILNQMRNSPPKGREYENQLEQLRILYRRTRMLKNTLTAAGVCILFVVLTIGATFSHLLIGFPSTNVAVFTFMLALICLTAMTLGFILDFLNSLNAVKLEIDFALDDSQATEHNLSGAQALLMKNSRAPHSGRSPAKSES